jgi:AraC-like DNA-binding protein
MNVTTSGLVAHRKAPTPSAVIAQPVAEAVAAALVAELSNLLPRATAGLAHNGLHGESTEQLANIVAALSAIDPQGHVFLEAGRRFTDVHFGMVGPVVMAQRTARSAIETLWACHAAVGGSPWRLQVVDQQARFGYSDSLPPSGVPYAQLAVSVAYHAALRFWGCATASQVSVNFGFAPPSGDGRAAYERVFGDRVRFGTVWTGLCFPAALLDLERVGVDHALAARMREFALASCSPEASVHTWTWRVENALRTSSAQDMRGVRLVAKALRVSTRTLRRRLSEEGSTFSDVAGRVRRERAIQLLLETDASYATVARVAGYADPNSLRRAFMKSLGRSPRQVRNNGLPR